MDRGATGRFSEEVPYARVGDGPRVLVVLPGVTDALFDGTYSRVAVRFLRRYYHRFGNEYTVYVISRPRGLAAGTTIRDMADDYATLIGREFDAATVWGLSMGGCIAQRLAAEHPERVEELVLMATGARLSEAGRALVDELRRRAYDNEWGAIRAKLAAETYSDWRGLFYPPAIASVGRLTHPRPAVASDAWTSFEALLDYDGRGGLRRIEARTLVLGGGDDRLFPPPILGETADAIPEAELDVIDGAGHGVFLTHKPTVERRMLVFLGV
ncbi:alpha/beta fold hydrolase [Halalkalicoccus jeotgali]|uniref:Alpha/beta hydrolase fold protein n=1 Tax=Halalkalicoccus jeotgali (strain DSM 18796 / CECT 7217 / JCM 14584 / KCTC 4019 / B3) TaxID=795797 RepID=D8J5V7_HALJB|nr:alpha/beta hydrolase [Halalkalicoccus jeotgali]ADJ13763.1 alpha/beta hydrolase fold protein [Halalkalicoccus jeotgali B3]ELY34191.1 alpha/beta hydrolase fold protein [Halalkalicoccus jeotgali B3]